MDGKIVKFINDKMMLSLRSLAVTSEWLKAACSYLTVRRQPSNRLASPSRKARLMMTLMPLP